MSDPLECSKDATFTRCAALLLTLAAVLHGIAIWKAEPLQSANDRSRWATVRSLLEQRTYRIDEVRRLPGWDTIDLILKDGHFYSTKPPLMATWVTAVVGAIKGVTGWTWQTNLHSIHAVTLLIVNLIPWLLCVWGWSTWLDRQSSSTATRLFLLAFALFGTLLSPFLTTLNNHLPAACGVWAATLCWVNSGNAQSRSGWLRFALWGFASSWAACHDLPAAAFTVVMAAMAWRQNAVYALTAFLPAALLPVIAFLTCNALALGSITPAYSGYGGETYRFLFEGEPSYWLRPQGIDRNLDSPVAYFLNCTIGHHGWWMLTPVWLLAFGPNPRSIAADAPEGRLTAVTCGLSLIVLGFYMTRTENYNYGGVSCALRWALFLIPLWLFMLARRWNGATATTWQMGLGWIALLMSLSSAWLPMSRPWQQPWTYEVADWLGLVPGKEPPPPLPRPLYSWIAELPPADSTGRYFVEFARETTQGTRESLRIARTATVTVRNRHCVVIEATLARNGQVVEQSRLLIDHDRFYAGRPPAECLVWTDSTATLSRQQQDLSWFRGLPLLQAYRPGYERYIHLPLRSDAFACQRAAAQCDVADSGSPAGRVRSDLWLSPEIPFGTARREWTWTSTTGELLQKETWTVVACEPMVSPTTPVTVDMFESPQPIVEQLRAMAR